MLTRRAFLLAAAAVATAHTAFAKCNLPAPPYTGVDLASGVDSTAWRYVRAANTRIAIRRTALAAVQWRLLNEGAIAPMPPVRYEDVPCYEVSRNGKTWHRLQPLFSLEPGASNSVEACNRRALDEAFPAATVRGAVR